MDPTIIPEFVLIAPAPRTDFRTKQPEPSLCNEWIAALKEVPEPLAARFKVKEMRLDCDVLSKEFGTFDCVVSPANSFGIMDGGYDMALSLAFQVGKDIWALTNSVQDVLKRRHRGYLPPGSCTLVPLSSQLTSSNCLNCTVLAVVPTMRVPEPVAWHVDLVYDSMWNLLTALWQWNLDIEDGVRNGKKIERVLMTGLATGCGEIGAKRCARQMILAVRHFAEGWGDHPRWNDVGKRVTEINETRSL
ncbi:macro domain-like protein [Panus rudis PR-1116 ss-1]|nr:macro domain-like protein [Panus rudis PR-1116 ss-1]